MKCRLCGSNSNVTDTRHNEDGDSIYRRRNVHRVVIFFIL